VSTKHWLIAVPLVVGVGCGNDPHPKSDSSKKVLYGAFNDAPRRLDPAQAYDVVAHAITGLVYDKLVEYHYLKRPFELMPGLAVAVPDAEPLAGGHVLYRFELRKSVFYAEDPCFELASPGLRTREATTRDIAFQLHRLADPALEVQVRDAFLNIAGFREFMAALGERRESDPAFAAKPAHVQYAEIGSVAGVRTPDAYTLEIELSQPYPQILYWFAIEFTTPVPWEAVQYYDGQGARESFVDHPVGTGPFVLTRYDKQARIVLERNPRWYGLTSPDAPGAFYPTEGEAGDEEAGLLDPETIGKRLPFVDRIEYARDKEAIPAFNKFLQGYYDRSAIIKESFDQVVRNDRISPEMAARGVSLSSTVAPTYFYIGFNMEDAVVGVPAGERGKKLRQAMSHAIDAQEWIDLFLNGRGLAAQSMVPPGLFGYDASYRNPYDVFDLSRARKLLAEAGYPNGIDTRTGKPLRLTLDGYAVSTQQKLQDEYFVNAWRKLGLDVQLSVTTYNEFQAKVQRLAYQTYFWGWSADYPDPENFLFLRSCDQRRSTVGGPNSTNFCDPRFEALYRRMRTRADDAERYALIREMNEILAEERPHIDLYHQEDYLLVQGWLHNVKQFGMSNPMAKYWDVDPLERRERRLAWNRPVRWPALALGLVLLAAVLPAIRTFFRERQ